MCKISCAGPQTYREHLEGQKHKRREASLKMAATAATTSQNRGNSLHCELCDVTCTGNDAYAAHVRGSKHQKVVKLHQKLGKPIPTVDPNFKKQSKINFVPAGTDAAATSSVAPTQATTGSAATNDTSSNVGTTATSGNSTQKPSITNAMQSTSAEPNSKIEPMDDDNGMAEDDIKPVGNEYIEEIKDDDGKMIKFNCKLCECGFNDPNAKEMHMKGRRHRLQYKRKVQPDLVVDFKPTPRQRRIAEAKAQRAVMQADYWNRQRNMGGDEMIDEPMYWDERRRFENEFEFNMPWNRGFNVPRGPHHLRPPHPFFAGMMPPGRTRPESFDDRHVIARHAEIYPKEEELQVIQRIVSHTERALKFVSDVLTEKSLSTPTPTPNVNNGTANKDEAKDGDSAATSSTGNDNKPKEDGRDNQMFSFQKDADSGSVRLLKGVMRVGLLAKGLLNQFQMYSLELLKVVIVLLGLLLQGDKTVQLVVLCAEKPSIALLKRVALELPVQLKQISEDHQYNVAVSVEESAVLVADESITVKVLLTSPLLRDPQQGIYRFGSCFLSFFFFFVSICSTRARFKRPYESTARFRETSFIAMNQKPFFSYHFVFIFSYL